MKRLLVIALLMIAVIFAASQALAATATNNINVLANVVGSCTISTAATDVDFGTYDPTAAAADNDGSSSVGFRCVKNTTYWTYITRTNVMTGAVLLETLNYQLYTDGAMLVPWDSAKVGGGTSAASNAETTIDIFGQIPALQDVSADAYTEAVTVTVEW